MKYLLALLLPLPLLAASPLFEEPWGKDAGIRYCENLPSEPEKPNPVVRGATAMIRFHQLVISPVQGPRSHFYPTSSQYTLLAMQRHGLIKGFVMGCSRLERENADPWHYRQITVHNYDRKEDIP